MSRPTLSQLWPVWSETLAGCPALDGVARPALLPHLRRVDADQQQDITHTMGLDGHVVTPAQAATVLAGRAHQACAAGWPGPVPAMTPGTEPLSDRTDRTVLGAYASALIQSRRTILDLLQGAEAIPALAAGYSDLRLRCLGRIHCESRGMSGDLPVMWELAAAEANWSLRAALLHLAIWRCEGQAGGTGRMARLLMNTLRAAAGHQWLTLPVRLSDHYDNAVRAALGEGDAGPWSDLICEIADTAV